MPTRGLKWIKGEILAGDWDVHVGGLPGARCQSPSRTERTGFIICGAQCKIKTRNLLFKHDKEFHQHELNCVGCIPGSPGGESLSTGAWMEDNVSNGRLVTVGTSTMLL